MEKKKERAEMRMKQTRALPLPIERTPTRHKPYHTIAISHKRTRQALEKRRKIRKRKKLCMSSIFREEKVHPDGEEENENDV